MERNWISCPLVEPRLDAEYYSEEFTAAAARLRRHVPTVPFVETWREYNRIYIGIAGFEKVQDQSEFTPYLRPTDIGDTGEIDYQSLPWCRKSWLVDYARKGCAQSGDLIVEVKGNTRRVAVISDQVPANCIVSGSSYRLKLKDSFDVFFAKAFLLSPLGQRLKRRLVSNTTISYIDPDSFRNYSFPRAQPELQAAIGNFLRKAERLREIAQDARNSFKAWICEAAALDKMPEAVQPFLEQSPDDCRTDFTWVSNRMVIDRLDPWPHHVAPRSIISHIMLHGSARAFDDFFQIVTSSRKRLQIQGAINGQYHLSVLDVDYNGHINWGSAETNRYDGAGVLVQPGDVLFSCLNPKETRVCVIPKNFQGAIVASPEFAILNLKSGIAAPFLLTAILRSNFLRVQTSFLTRSSSLSRRRLHEEDLSSAVLPWLEANTLPLENKLAMAVDAQVESDSLVQKAITAVESLVDAKLDEPSLLLESAKIEEWLQSHPPPSVSQ